MRRKSVGYTNHMENKITPTHKYKNKAISVGIKALFHLKGNTVFVDFAVLKLLVQHQLFNMYQLGKDIYLNFGQDI